MLFIYTEDTPDKFPSKLIINLIYLNNLRKCELSPSQAYQMVTFKKEDQELLKSVKEVSYCLRLFCKDSPKLMQMIRY